MEVIECSHPGCHCQIGLVQTDLGYLCGVHVQQALDICRGEQRLIECEEKLKVAERERDEWKRIALLYRSLHSTVSGHDGQRYTCNICKAYDALVKGE